MTKQRVLAALLSGLFAVLLLIGALPPARADALDEILEYAITVDVNEDGTLNMHYHIVWKVLDSTSEGPLSWVMVGIPNTNVVSLQKASSTISNIEFSSGNGSYVRIDLDRDYYEDEVVSFDFDLVQDYMYEMNRFADGETYYEFTPGWFDAAVDALIVKWNSDRVKSVSPACLLREDGYYTWQTSLAPGETFTVSASYPNDAFAFDESKSIGGDDYYDGEYFGPDGGYEGGSSSEGMLASLLPILFVAVVAFFVIKGKQSYSSTANFSGGESKKVITREKITYHTSCPGCGAPRSEGKDNCE